MIVKQFLDEPLAQYGYAIISDGEMAVIDPGRNETPYLELAEATNSRIVASCLTHPHADFVSSYWAIAQKTGAKVYASELIGLSVPYVGLKDGDEIKVGKAKLKAYLTPGHSPDSMTYVLYDEDGREYAAFTGDWLFIGDVGRADLRAKAGNIQKQREDQARDMYHSLRRMFSILKPETIVYPAHGAGTLCGKALKQFNASSIGVERMDNWAVILAHQADEKTFIEALVTGQPHVPKYFPNSVEVNRSGPKGYKEALDSVKVLGRLTAESAKAIDRNAAIVDARPASAFRQGHLRGAINIPLGKTFNTWLGTLISPTEPYYLVVSSSSAYESAISQVLAIGYESYLRGVFIGVDYTEETGPELFPRESAPKLKSDSQNYFVLDVRDPDEVSTDPILSGALHIRLSDLRERVNEVNTDKAIIVHCAGGYRSAVGSSILLAAGKKQVYDLSEAVSLLRN
ncbi:MAG: MBL fold metallo-hydrolase [Bacteroidia bacterium]|nr:MBL fold metallo-hydrolase [Bacteroidia bacterium]MCX7651535.1 MBL fold metallo-hydrolase [Bacteroidia bacterium]MDW8416832.1 MBL fold metallo-hydrolase [Bacteroidia bacterium]